MRFKPQLELFWSLIDISLRLKAADLINKSDNHISAKIAFVTEMVITTFLPVLLLMDNAVEYVYLRKTYLE